MTHHSIYIILINLPTVGHLRYLFTNNFHYSVLSIHVNKHFLLSCISFNHNLFNSKHKSTNIVKCFAIPVIATCTSSNHVFVQTCPVQFVLNNGSCNIEQTILGIRIQPQKQPICLCACIQKKGSSQVSYYKPLCIKSLS